MIHQPVKLIVHCVAESEPDSTIRRKAPPSGSLGKRCSIAGLGFGPLVYRDLTETAAPTGLEAARVGMNGEEGRGDFRGDASRHCCQRRCFHSLLSRANRYSLAHPPLNHTWSMKWAS